VLVFYDIFDTASAGLFPCDNLTVSGIGVIARLLLCRCFGGGLFELFGSTGGRFKQHRCNCWSCVRLTVTSNFDLVVFAFGTLVAEGLWQR
jgi:hypothetical protein